MAKVVVSKARSSAGAITAPKSAAGGPTTGLGVGRAVPQPKKAPSPYAVPSAGLKSAAAAISGTSFSDVHPAASPAAPYTGTPWSSAEELSNAGADAKYAAALTNLGYKKLATEREYGLDQGFNDYKANPYSRAALLEQTYQRANRASGNSLASMGQLYSGASQNAETYNRENNSQERNALESTYRKALQGYTDEEAAAKATREEEKAAAKWKAIEAASNADLEPEAAPAGGGGGGTPAKQGGGVTKKNKQGKKIGVSGARKA